MLEPLVLVLAGVVVIALASALAPRLGIAGPLILVGLGVGVSLLPFVPDVVVEPEWILVGVLPPLLYSSAVALPAIEFRRDFRPIAGLSVLLVIVSSIALGAFFYFTVPGLGLPLSLALGAILSPTDAVATTIAKRLGISPRVVTLVEGESLLNDATALVFLRTAVAAFVAGSVSWGQAIGAFVWGTVIAIIVGAIIGYLNLRLRQWVAHSAANTALSFVVPFVAYLPTEQLGGSGLVAAVVAGIVTGQGAARRFTPEQRLSDQLNWRTVELVLEGGVFLLMGLELKAIIPANLASDRGIIPAIGLTCAAFVIVLVVRALYVSGLIWRQGRRARGKRRQQLESFQQRIDHLADGSDAPPSRGRDPSPARKEKLLATSRARLTRAFTDLDYYQASPLGWRHGTLIVWAGMRGVVTVAAAQTLPRDTPDRALLVFVAFLIAISSLMLQGFTLPPLARMLGLAGEGKKSASRQEQRALDDELRQAAAAALSRPDLARRDGAPFPDGFVALASERLTELPEVETEGSGRDVLELRLAIIAARRARLNELSSQGTFSTPALRLALAELDADELGLRLRLDDD